MTQIKRVIQGEAAGDLVLEEDLSTGGGGVPIGGGGLAEAHLDSGAGGGSAHVSRRMKCFRCVRRFHDFD